MFGKKKTTVLILSTMRSGSTLLKSLLAVAPDVSDLPEVNFQQCKTRKDWKQIQKRSDTPILVLKYPAWFKGAAAYPKIPRFVQAKKIVLVRDVYETVRSLQKMLTRPDAVKLEDSSAEFLATSYWKTVTENLLAKRNDPDTLLIRYEDLTADPIAQTARIFRFIGSAQPSGIDHYNPPEHGWSWKQDDGGETIRMLHVLPPKKQDRSDESLMNIIRTSESICGLRAALNYPPL